ATDGPIEHDPGPAQQLPVLPSEHAGAEMHFPAVCHRGNATDEMKSLALHRGMKVADEQDIDVTFAFRPARLGRVTRQAEQVRLPRLREPRLVHQLNADRIREDEIAEGKRR